jgi:hypothetical protein
VLNGDLATITSVDHENRSLTVRLDRDPEARELPGWYLDKGNVDYGYAMTGHKAQGVTADRSFVVIDGNTDREWAYVAMSRGRQNNTLYLANPEPTDEQCTHLTHQDSHDSLDGLIAALNRSAAQTAATDQIRGTPGAYDVDSLGPPPPSSDVTARVAWQIAKRQAERDEAQHGAPGLDVATGR